jgi:hypothetical protein
MIGNILDFVALSEGVSIKESAQILHDQFIEPQPQKLSIVSRFKALFSWLFPRVCKDSAPSLEGVFKCFVLPFKTQFHLYLANIKRLIPEAYLHFFKVGRTSLNKNASITTAYTPGAQTPKSSQRCTHTASPVSGNPRATQTTAQFSTASCIFAGFFRPAFFFSSGSIGAEQ